VTARTDHDLEHDVGGHSEQEPQLIGREARATRLIHGHAGRQMKGCRVPILLPR
jgi:hypothetical protein